MNNVYRVIRRAFEVFALAMFCILIQSGCNPHSTRPPAIGDVPSPEASRNPNKNLDLISNGKDNYLKAEITGMYDRHEDDLQYIVDCLLSMDVPASYVSFLEDNSLIFFRYYDEEGKPIPVDIGYQSDIKLYNALWELLIDEAFGKLYIEADQKAVFFGPNAALQYSLDQLEVYPNSDILGRISGNWYYYEEPFE
jgi:hypothetical protein